MRLTEEEKARRKAERDACTSAAIERRAKEIVAQAPPLTPEQIARLRDIFAGRDVATSKKKVVDTAQAARMLRCGVRRITQLRNRGQLTGHKVGGRWLYDRDQIQWLRSSLERAARGQAVEDAAMNDLIDLLIQDRLQKAWNPS